MFFDACGTYHITHNGTNCTQMMANMYAMMAAARAASPTNWSSADLNSSSAQGGAAGPGPGPGGGGGGVVLESQFQKVVELYVISLLAAFGLVGNALAVIVLRQDRERRDALFLLQAVAVADACYLVVAVLRYPLRYLISPAADGSSRWVDMQPVVFPFLKTFQVRCYSFHFPHSICDYQRIFD